MPCVYRKIVHNFLYIPSLKGDKYIISVDIFKLYLQTDIYWVRVMLNTWLYFEKLIAAHKLPAAFAVPYDKALNVLRSSAKFDRVPEIDADLLTSNVAVCMEFRIACGILSMKCHQQSCIDCGYYLYSHLV